MHLHRVPRELIVIALSSILFSILTILLALFTDQFRWWALTWSQFRVSFLTVLGCGVFFIGLLLRFPNWARRWLMGCAIGWFAFCFMAVQKTPYASLIIFFILSHTLLWILYRSLTQLISLPHIRMGVDWFYGPGQFIPHLKAELEYSGKKVPMKVSSISFEGLSLFFQDSMGEIPLMDELNVNLHFRDRSYLVPSEVITSYSNKKGLKRTLLGLKFKVLNPDQEKDLSDFLERLRGEGHEF